MNAYDAMMIQAASNHFKDDNFEPVPFETATASLTTTEAWAQVVENGLLCNKRMDSAIDQLANKCALPEPVKPMANQLLSCLEAIVTTWLGVADEPLNEVDRQAMFSQYQRGGIAAVLVAMLNEDNDWPSDDLQRENKHGDN